MQLPLFQIDAFATKVFRGNPAAVCPLSSWLPDSTLQAIAQENNLSETAFFVAEQDSYRLRWFTPRQEVDLCGHATLAAAHVIFCELGSEKEEIEFNSRSGTLSVKREENLLSMDFPALHMEPCFDPPGHLMEGLRREPDDVLLTEEDPNYYAIYSSADDVRELQPDLAKLERLHPYGTVATAVGREADFISRYFAPSYGIPEDPVTGSIHCALTPYWASRLDKTHLRAQQASHRGGELFCEPQNDRVRISGRAVKYLQGTLSIQDEVIEDIEGAA